MFIFKSKVIGSGITLSLLHVIGLMASVALSTLAMSQAASAQESFRCAGENAFCHLPGAKHYSTSYGTADRSIIVETEKLDALPCSNDLGDPHFGVEKSCNAVEFRKEASRPALSFRHCSNENDKCEVKKSEGEYSVVRFGAKGNWLYNNVASDVGCWNGGFGFDFDPAPKVGKICEVSTTRLPATDSSWTICANEGGDCTPLAGFGTYLVKYGVDTRWVYRTVVGRGIACDERAFGVDPAFSTYKSCQYIGIPSVKEIQGEWIELNACGGCGANTYEFEWGVERGKSREETSHWTQEVRVSVEADFKVIGIGGTTTVESVTNFGESNAIASSFTETAGTTFSLACDKGAFWQLNIKVDEFCRPNSPSCSTVARSKVFQCTTVGDTPKANWPTNNPAN